MKLFQVCRMCQTLPLIDHAQLTHNEIHTITQVKIRFGIVCHCLDEFYFTHNIKVVLHHFDNFQALNIGPFNFRSLSPHHVVHFIHVPGQFNIFCGVLLNPLLPSHNLGVYDVMNFHQVCWNIQRAKIFFLDCQPNYDSLALCPPYIFGNFLQFIVEEVQLIKVG